MGILLFFPSAGPATWEMTFTLEGTSPIDVTGQKTDVTFEMAFTCEGATTVVATTTLTEATWAMAYTNEGVTTVDASGGKTDATFAMEYTCEGVSTVASTGNKTDATWEMAFACEGVSAVVATGTMTEPIWEMSYTVESVSSIVASSGKTDATWAMEYTCEGVTSVAAIGEKVGGVREASFTLEGATDISASGQKTDATWEMAYTNEGITTTVASGNKTDVTWEIAFTNEGTTTTAVVGDKSGYKEMAYTLEGVTTTVASGGKTDATFEMAYTNEGITSVVATSQKTDATWGMSFTVEGVTTTVSSGQKSEATWPMSFTCEGITSVVASGQKSDVTWSMEHTVEGTTTVVASAQKTDATWEMSFTNEGTTSTVTSGGKTDATFEMSFTCEGTTPVAIEAFAIPLGETLEIGMTVEGRSDLWAYGYLYLSTNDEMKFRILGHSYVTVEEGRSFAGVQKDMLIREWHGSLSSIYGQTNQVGTSLSEGYWWDNAGGTEEWRNTNGIQLQSYRTNAPLIWWNLDNETGDEWVGTGTESDPYALKLDGTDTYLDVGYYYTSQDPNYQLKFTDISPDMTFSAEIWWKPGSLAATEYLLELDFIEVDENHAITSADSIPRFSIRQKTDGKIYVICRTISGSTVELSGTTAHTDANFHHVVVSCFGVLGSFYLWVDGVMEKSGPVPGSASSDYAWNSFAVGTNRIVEPPTYFQSGHIAAVRLYNQALDDVDIIQNYLAGPHRAAYLPMAVSEIDGVKRWSVLGTTSVSISAESTSENKEMALTVEGTTDCASSGEKADYINELDITVEGVSEPVILGDVFFPWLKDISYTVIGQSGATITGSAQYYVTMFARSGCNTTVMIVPTVAKGPIRRFRPTSITGVKQATIFRKQKRVSP